jgi:hypothetical protein
MQKIKLWLRRSIVVTLLLVGAYVVLVPQYCYVSYPIEAPKSTDIRMTYVSLVGLTILERTTAGDYIYFGCFGPKRVSSR